VKVVYKDGLDSEKCLMVQRAIIKTGITAYGTVKSLMIGYKR